MTPVTFKDGYEPGYCGHALIDEHDEYAVIKHNSWGKWSEVIQTGNDYDSLFKQFVSDLYDDYGQLADTVTSIHGVKPRYEIVLLSCIIEEA